MRNIKSKSKKSKMAFTKRKNFFNPHFSLDDWGLLKGGGVYKLVFSTGHYYIGSTKNFNQRFFVYKYAFRKEVYPESKKINECIKKSTSARFEILFQSAEPKHVKKREDKFLRDAWGDEFLINRSPSAYSNKGIKWTKQEVESSVLSGKNGNRGKRGRGKKWEEMSVGGNFEKK